MENRLNRLQEEERSLLEIKRICETIIQNNLPLSAVNESLLNKDNENWKIILEKIMHEDTTKESLTKKQFNQNIIIMLTFATRSEWVRR